MKKSFFFLLLLSSASLLHAQNVGIGVPNPQEKLDVDGGVRVGNTTSNNSGTVRFNGTEMEYNTGFGWRSLVNAYSESALSGMTPFISTTRNAWVEVTGVSLTITTPGVYLIIYKASGSNNNSYFTSGGNYDISGTLDFRMNGGGLTTAARRFLAADYTGDASTTKISFVSNPTEFSTVQNVVSSSTFKIYASVTSTGTVTGDWTINEASITAIRLY